MTSERVTSGAKLALLSAALVLLVAACDQQGTGEAEQGAAPTVDQSTTAATEGEQPEQQQ